MTIGNVITIWRQRLGKMAKSAHINFNYLLITRKWLNVESWHFYTIERKIKAMCLRILGVPGHFAGLGKQDESRYGTNKRTQQIKLPLISKVETYHLITTASGQIAFCFCYLSIPCHPFSRVRNTGYILFCLNLQVSRELGKTWSWAKSC